MAAPHRIATLLAVLLIAPATVSAEIPVIVDSAVTREQALEGVASDCPKEILSRQRLVTVRYYSFDGRIHSGQLVVDKDCVADVKKLFDAILDSKFPVTSVIPISHKRFREDGKWSDRLSMEADNTSGFNYRRIAGTDRLSCHASGRAIDINPRLNPWIKNGKTAPANGGYNPAKPGTLTPDHPIVRLLEGLGWTWGGRWESVKDYQHFEKRGSSQ